MTPQTHRHRLPADVRVIAYPVLGGLHHKYALKKSLPNHRDINICAPQLPIGTHFVGRFGDEVTLFRLAAQLEAVRPWAEHWPSLSIRKRRLFHTLRIAGDSVGLFEILMVQEQQQLPRPIMHK